MNNIINIINIFISFGFQLSFPARKCAEERTAREAAECLRALFHRGYMACSSRSPTFSFARLNPRIPVLKFVSLHLISRVL